MNASFDIMHCHDWMTAPALKILKTMMDRKCIFTMHSTNGIRCGSKTFGSLTNKVIELEQDGVGFCDRVVGVTGPLCDRIKVDYSFDWDKLRCIPYAFPFGEYENDNQGFDVRRKFHWDRNDFLIMYFGLFSPNRVSFEGQTLQKRSPVWLFDGLKRRCTKTSILHSLTELGDALGCDEAGSERSPSCEAGLGWRGPYGS